MPFIGSNTLSHTHDVIAFVVRVIGKSLSEFITVSESLILNKFQVRSFSESVTSGEALTVQVYKQRALSEIVNLPEEPDFVIADFVPEIL